MTAPEIKDERIELKYTIDSNLSDQIRHWAQENLGQDPHCTNATGDSYEVNTLYLDTPDLDLYHRNRQVGRSKLRIRRYGNEERLWLESKRKKGDVVRKNRTVVHPEEIVSNLECETIPNPWSGAWFIDNLRSRNMQPAVQVHYQRFARTSVINGENIRLTIDSSLASSPVCGWNVATNGQMEDPTRRPIANQVQILELKFHNRMPLLLKDLLRLFSIPATGFSKYRSAVECILNPKSDCNGQVLDCPFPAPNNNQESLNA